MEVINYHRSYDAYRQGDIADWSKHHKLDYVVELHRNAFNGSARGYETIINSSYSADNADKALHNAMLSLGFINRGIKGRDNLANCNRMAGTGISYSLIELDFIDNAEDNSIFDNNVNKIGTLIFDALESAGVKRLGVICGHGGGDPGACAFGRREDVDVRKIWVTKGAVAPEPPVVDEKPIPLPSEKDRYRLPDGSYILKNRTSGTVMDCSKSRNIAHGWAGNESERQIMNWSNATEHWTTTNGDKRVLDFPEPSFTAGTQFIFWSEEHTHHRQQFIHKYRGMTEAGFSIIQIINKYSGKAVDLDDDKKENGVKIHGANPNSSINQEWIAIPIRWFSKEEIDKSFKK